MADDDWWFCLKHHTVESDADRCKAADRLGPYTSREDAEHALDKVAERNAEADREDDWGDRND